MTDDGRGKGLVCGVGGGEGVVLPLLLVTASYSHHSLFSPPPPPTHLTAFNRRICTLAVLT
jgi:hypothetical protein